MSLIIDGPGVLGRSGSGGQTRNQSVEALAPKPVTRKGCRVADVAEPQRCPVEQVSAGCWRKRAAHPGEGPHEAYDVMAALHQRAHRRPADGAGRA